MLKKYILPIFENALNKYISLDPEGLAKVKELAGSVLLIEEPHFNLRFYMVFTHSGIRLQTKYQGFVDTTLRGTPFALIQLTKFFENSHKTIFSGSITISGDVELGQKVQAIFDNLDIDLEEQLSHYTGDVIAHQVGNITRGLRSYTKNTAEILCQNFSEYLQEEQRFTPSRIELEDFLQEVEKLRDDVERVVVRASRL